METSILKTSYVITSCWETALVTVATQIRAKKTLLSLAYYPSDNFILEFYSDYENLPDSSHRRTLQGFVGYQKDWGRLGVQYARQIRTGNSDLALDSVSVFGVYNLSPRADLIGRYDRMFDPNSGWRANLLHTL